MNNEAPGVSDWIWVLVPLVGLDPQKGLVLMESSHLERIPENRIKPYSPSVPPGRALMFNNRLRTRDPVEGGGVVFVRCYDMTGL